MNQKSIQSSYTQGVAIFLSKQTSIKYHHSIMKKVFLCILILSVGIVTAQESPTDLPEIVPPSPTVANLMQFEEVPVDNYTGQPSISIPLFSKAVHKNLGLNIALNYNSQGIKIDNRSGWTATGWSLFAGGSVSRTVRGVPDEINDSKRTGIYHNDDFWNYENLTSEEQAEFNWNAAGTPYDQYDVEFDLYQFSLLGISGRFIMTREGPQLLSNQANVSITTNQDTTTGSIDSFIITDGNGYRYYFDVIEESLSEPFSGYVPQGGVGNIPPIDNRDLYTVRSAWHLSKVTTSNDQELVNLLYQESYEEYVASYSKTYNQIARPDDYSFTNNSYNTSVMRPQYSFTSTTIKTNTQKLSKINFLDGVTLDFIIGGQHPETNGEMLQDLIIRDVAGNENKRYHFNYQQTDRLWLNSVEEIPLSGDTNIHTLSYFDKENLAPFNSDSDPWGYNYTPLVNENYDPTIIKAGILTSITTPTGGVKEFLWEEHTYSYRGAHQLEEAEYIENPNNTETQFYTGDFTAQSPFVNNSPAPLATISLIKDQDVEVRITNVIDFQHPDDRVKVIFSLTNNPDDGLSISLKNETDFLEVPKGNYNVFVQYLGYNINPNFTKVDGRLRLVYQDKIDGALSRFVLGGGLRIKEVLFRDTPEASTPAKRLKYNYQSPDDNGISSGAADISFKGSIENEYRMDVAHYLFNLPTLNPGAFFGKNIEYKVTNKGTRSELTKGGYIGYKNVTVSEVDNGYTYFTYTSPVDYPTPANVFFFPFFPKQDLDYKRGLMLSQIVFDNQNRKLNEVINTDYDFYTHKIANLYKTADLQDCPERQFFDRFQWSLDNQDINVNRPEKNSPTCGGSPCKLEFSGCGLTSYLMMKRTIDFTWAQLRETVSKEYFYDDANTQSVVETKNRYVYNTENFQPKTVTRTITEGETTHQYIENTYFPVGGYPSEHFNSAQQSEINKMVALHKVNAPIYTENFKDNKPLSTIQNIYQEFVPNCINLQTVKTAKEQDALENRIQYYDYDDYGNPLEISQEDGSHIIYIWGYDNMYPIAKIANATYTGMPAAVKTLINQIRTASNTENTDSKETAFRNQLASLQSNSHFSDAQMSYYTYDPLIGVTSMTDSRGYTMYYSYDEFNRLQFVKDQDGNIVSENEYHYKNN